MSVGPSTDWPVSWGLLGTAKKNAPPPLAPELAAALATRSGLDPEHHLLLAAGAHHLYGETGRIPPRSEGVVPPPPDHRPAASPRAAQVLEELMERRTVLLAEAFSRLDRAGLRWPESNLSALFQLNRQQLATIPQALFLRVVDERGAWLAAQNPAWAWLLPAAAAEDPRQIWDNGPKNRRFWALCRQRELDPAEARRWLMESFKKEKAEQRVEGIEALQEGLGPEDEAFLESCLQDRSAAVRAAAALQLLRLPESAWCARAKARVAPLISNPAPAKGLLGGLRALVDGKKTLKIHLPENADPAWEAEGLNLLPPAGVGARAFLLCELVAWVPPDFFREHLELDAPALVAAIHDHEWEEAILLGWARATAALRDAEMAAAIFPRLVGLTQKKLYRAVAHLPAHAGGLCAHLFQLLPLASRVDWVIRFLETECPFNLFQALAGEGTWPLAECTRFVVAAQEVAQRLVDRAKIEHSPPFTLMLQVVHLLAPELPAINWPTRPEASPHYTSIIESFTEIFEARRRLAEEISL